MKSETELTQDILDITNKIHQEFPELIKYLKEMPLKFISSEKNGISAKRLSDYYNSLVDVVAEYSKTHLEYGTQEKVQKMDDLGYPIYAPSEDIYAHEKEEQDIDPENTNELKSPNETDYHTHHSGNDLDVPGSDLDDAQERIGNEDEENNYYSLGGDDHNDLEEDNGNERN